MNYRCRRAGPFSGNSSWFLYVVTGLLPCCVCWVCVCLFAYVFQCGCFFWTQETLFKARLNLHPIPSQGKGVLIPRSILQIIAVSHEYVCLVWFHLQTHQIRSFAIFELELHKRNAIKSSSVYSKMGKKVNTTNRSWIIVSKTYF